MPRGRRPLPDEIKELRGNPGKRKLLQDIVAERPRPRSSKPVEPPAFLTDDREKEILTRVVRDYLQGRVARTPDMTAYGRWAAYVHRWISCKEALDGKSTWFTSETKWGKILRRHPLFKDMLDLERVLQSLEDRLGLNPIARQNIIRGLTTLPQSLSGSYDTEQLPSGEGEEAKSSIDQSPPEESPLAYLQTAGKPN